MQGIKKSVGWVVKTGMPLDAPRTLTHSPLCTFHQRSVLSLPPLTSNSPLGPQVTLSKPQLARMRPSGLQATLFTRSVCPVSVWRRLPLATSHSLTVRSQLALARVLPSGEKASPRTRLLCPAMIATQVAGCVFCISHTRICPVVPPLASRRPSGLQTTERIGLGCRSVCRGAALWESQSRTVASFPPLASRPPLGAKATLSAPAGCHPDQSRALLSRSHNLIVSSQLPLANVRPSGLKARAYVVSVCACLIHRRVWPSSSQIRTSPRLLAAAQYCPLLLIATAQVASKVSVKTVSWISAPASVVSCISTPCRCTLRRDSRDRLRPRRCPRCKSSSASTLAGP